MGSEMIFSVYYISSYAVMRHIVLSIITLVLSGVCICCSALYPPPDIPLTLYSSGTSPEKGDCILILAGDIMLSRHIERLSRIRNDYLHPFRKVTPLLLSGDITFANLETPLCEGDTPLRGLHFRADPGFASAMKKSGITLLSLANNHILDWKKPGADNTLQSLYRAGIGTVGFNKKGFTGTPYFTDIRGITVAFLAFTDCINAVPLTQYSEMGILLYGNNPSFIDAVKTARHKADCVIVSLHWGSEYGNNPLSQQVTLARAAIDAGADIIIGHHPHVLQRYEHYRNGHIFYSLGNFVFDQKAREATRRSAVIRVIVTHNGISRIDAVPVFINDVYQPITAGPDKAREIYKALKK